MEEILRLIDERKIQMIKLWEKGHKLNQEILDISIEIDQFYNEYYRLSLVNVSIPHSVLPPGEKN